MRKTNGLKVERVIGGFGKSPRKVIEARLVRVEGALMADFRAFVATDDGRLVPTAAGLTLRPGQLPALAKLVEDARAAAEGVPEGAESDVDGPRKGDPKKKHLTRQERCGNIR